MIFNDLRLPSFVLPTKGPSKDQAVELSTISSKNISSEDAKVHSGFEKFAKIVPQMRAKETQYKCFTVSETEDVDADYSYVIRALFIHDAPSIEAIGITTGINAYMGALATSRAVDRYKKAMKQGNEMGVTESVIDGARGFSQTLCGFTYLVYRIATLVCLALGLNDSIYATSLAGKISYYSGMLGNAFYTLFYGAIGIWGAYLGVKNLGFRGDVEEKESDELFEFLLNQAETNPKEIFEKLQARFAANDELPFFKDQMKKLALARMCERFAHRQEGLEHALSTEEMEVVFEKLFESTPESQAHVKTYFDKIGVDISKLGFDNFTLLGFMELLSQDSQAKKTQFGRIANAGLAEKVRKMAQRGFLERLHSSDNGIQTAAKTELAALKIEVLDANKTNCYVHTALVIVGMIGIAASVIYLFPLLAPGLIAGAVLTVLAALGMLGIDGLFLKWNLGGVIPGLHDKKFVIAAAVIITVAFAVCLGMTIGLGWPLLPLIAAGIIWGLSMATCGVSYYRAGQKEKEWKENHPSLGEFLQKLTGLKDEERVALFKKLPKEDRMAIRKQLLAAPFNGELDEAQEKNALKKTAKHFWMQWNGDKSDVNLNLALQAQGLLDNGGAEPQGITAVLQENRQYVGALKKGGDLLKKIVEKRHQIIEGLKDKTPQAVFEGLTAAERALVKAEFENSDALKFANADYARFDRNGFFGRNYLLEKISLQSSELDKSLIKEALRETANANELLRLAEGNQWDLLKNEYTKIAYSRDRCLTDELEKNIWYVCMRNDNNSLVGIIIKLFA